MKKTSLFLLLIVVLGCAVFVLGNRADHTQKISSIRVSDDELIADSSEGYNSIKIYRHENLLIINAESEAAFFDGAQLVEEVSDTVTSENIEIIWMTITGSTEKTEDNDRMIAEIKISANGELLYDTRINFAKKAFDAVEDVLHKVG